MSDSIKNKQNEIPEEDKLLDYLKGNLSEEDQHALERKLLEDEFAYNAMEGLESMENKKDLEPVISQLNNQLKKNLEFKKRRKSKRTGIENLNIYYAVILLLLLVIISYIITRQINS